MNAWRWNTTALNFNSVSTLKEVSRVSVEQGTDLQMEEGHVKVRTLCHSIILN